jgi:hypothetical protein
MAEVNQSWSVVTGTGQPCSVVAKSGQQGHQCGMIGHLRHRHVLLVIILGPLRPRLIARRRDCAPRGRAATSMDRCDERGG